MYFAVSSIDSYFLSQGVLGAIVLVLASVCVFLYRKNDALQSKLDAIQEQRIMDAREVSRSITSPLEKIAEQNKSIYDVVLNSKSRN